MAKLSCCFGSGIGGQNYQFWGNTFYFPKGITVQILNDMGNVIAFNDQFNSILF